MTRLLIHVEGQTEETFVNEILQPHLADVGVFASARILGNARLGRDHRGGIRGWDGTRNDIVGHLSGDVGCVATTMVDYYGLPHSGGREWPGRAEATLAPFQNRAAIVQNAMHENICTELGAGFDRKRFIPFVVMHEFEGLLFSDCQKLAAGIERPG